MAAGNRWLASITSFTLVTLAATIELPPVEALFAFARPSAAMLAAAAGAGTLRWVWLATVNRMFARRGR